jgi:hypothetical protein
VTLPGSLPIDGAGLLAAVFVWHSLVGALGLAVSAALLLVGAIPSYSRQIARPEREDQATRHDRAPVLAGPPADQGR